MFNIGFLGPQGTYSSYASDLYSQNDKKIQFDNIQAMFYIIKTRNYYDPISIEILTSKNKIDIFLNSIMSMVLT